MDLINSVLPNTNRLKFDFSWSKRPFFSKHIDSTCKFFLRYMFLPSRHCVLHQEVEKRCFFFFFFFFAYLMLVYALAYWHDSISMIISVFYCVFVYLFAYLYIINSPHVTGENGQSWRKLAKMSKVLQSSSKLHQKMRKVGKNVKSFTKFL